MNYIIKYCRYGRDSQRAYDTIEEAIIAWYQAEMDGRYSGYGIFEPDGTAVYTDRQWREVCERYRAITGEEY